MLGSVADAEDVVQEAFIRWMGADRSEVREPEAFLRRTVTRLCLDQLKSARRQRETYVGPWLPEPIVEEDEDEDITLPLMLALERLSPLERAAFLLHDVFGIGFEEIAETIQRSPAACRQLAARARPTSAKHAPAFRWRSSAALRSPTPSLPLRATATWPHSARCSPPMSACMPTAAASGPQRRNRSSASTHVMRVHEALAVLFRKHGSTLVRTALINGLPGFVTREADGELQTTALEIEDGMVTAIYVMRNPDKLRHLH